MEKLNSAMTRLSCIWLYITSVAYVASWHTLTVLSCQWIKVFC